MAEWVVDDGLNREGGEPEQEISGGILRESPQEVHLTASEKGLDTVVGKVAILTARLERMPAADLREVRDQVKGLVFANDGERGVVGQAVETADVNGGEAAE